MLGIVLEIQMPTLYLNDILIIIFMKTRLLTIHVSLFLILFFLLSENSFAQNSHYNNLEAAKLKVKNSDWDGALELLNHHLDTHPTDTTGLLLRARTLIQLDDLNLALADYSDILVRYPDQKSALQGRGDLFLKMDQIEQGILDWSNFLLIASVGERDQAYYKLGMGYLELKSYDDAVDFFDEAINLREDKAEYYTQKGIAFGRIGENIQAIEAFEKALSLDPSDSAATLGLAMIKSGSDPELLRQIEETIADSGAHSQTYKQRGFYRMNHQDEVGALEDFNMAIKDDFDDPENFYYRGLVYTRLKKWKEADADLTRALQLSPEDLNILLARGQARYRAAELVDALEDFTKLITMDGEHASGYFHRGITLHRLGRIAEACVELHKAEKLGMNQAKEVIAKICAN